MKRTRRSKGPSSPTLREATVEELIAELKKRNVPGWSFVAALHAPSRVFVARATL